MEDSKICRETALRNVDLEEFWASGGRSHTGLNPVRDFRARWNVVFQGPYVARLLAQ